MATPEPSRDDIFQPGGQIAVEYLNDAASQVLWEAVRFARDTGWDSVRSPHIFMGLLSLPDAGVRAWGKRLGANLDNLLGQFEELFKQKDGQGALLKLNREFLSDNVIRLLRDAHQRALGHGRRFITPMDLLITLLTATRSIVAECFERIGVTAAKLTELAVLAEQQGSD